MAADRNLISGAGKAVERDLGLVQSLGMAKISDQMLDAVEAIAVEKVKLGREFDNTISEYLNNGEYLSDKTLMDVSDILSEDKQTYIWGSKKDKMLLKRKMEHMRVEYAKISDDLNSIGTAIKNPQTKLNEDFKSSVTGQSIMNIYNGQNTAVPNRNAPQLSTNLDFQKLGFNIVMNEGEDPVWMDRNQIADLVIENSRDGMSSRLLDEQMQIAMQFAVVDKEYDSFRDSLFTSKLDNIINNGNLNSLTDHKFMELDTSFYDSLTEYIRTATYGDLGIELDTNALDPTPGDNEITKEDAEEIASYFTGKSSSDAYEYDSEKHKKAISEFYKLHLKRGWKDTLPQDEQWKYRWMNELGLSEQQIEAEMLLRKGRTASENKKYEKHGPTGMP